MIRNGIYRAYGPKYNKLVWWLSFIFVMFVKKDIIWCSVLFWVLLFYLDVEWWEKDTFPCVLKCWFIKKQRRDFYLFFAITGALYKNCLIKPLSTHGNVLVTCFFEMYLVVLSWWYITSFVNPYYIMSFDYASQYVFWLHCVVVQAHNNFITIDI